MDGHEAVAPDTYGERWADVYDEVHSFLVPSEDQLGLLAELAGGGRALELGIGTGRVALPLAASGVRVSGVDASPSMVERLRSKPGGGELEVSLGDMAKLSVTGEFNLVYVVFNTLFGLVTQAEQVACFRGVAGILSPAGTFCIECFVPNLTRFSGGQSLRVVRVGPDEVQVNASQHDPVSQRVAANMVRLDSSGVSVRPVRLRYAWPAELDLMAQLAGLRLRTRWQDWAQTPFTATSKEHVSVYEHAGGP